MARAVSGQLVGGSLRALRFAAVGVTGIGVNEALFIVFASAMGIPYLLAAVVATQGSTTWNFILLERWALAGRARGPLLRRYLAYAAVNNGALLLRLPLLWLLATGISLDSHVANLITLGVLFAVRFSVADRWIWAAMPAVAEVVAQDGGPGIPVMAATRPAARYRYDVAGIVRLHSDAELPELAHFRTEAVGDPDIVVRIGLVGGRPRRRIRFTPSPERLTYAEHLGPLGANFEIELGSPIQVVATPLLALSRHVLYTNVIEALLRFTLVERGYVLLHSGCVAKDGRATLLSAQTDTGKTSTVIRLVRDFGYEFLSDDMTIVHPGGLAISFPKPMTLSYHTMSTIAGARLGAGQRAKLAIQSRVHSKSGRSIGRSLGERNIPIMAINSATQIAVPPPKYHITKLLGCEVLPQARIERVVFIERGSDIRETMPLAAAVDLLIENTDDAYGFPPFATLAPHLRMGGADYEELRLRERALLAQAIGGSAIWRLRVPGHAWAEQIPAFADAEANASAPPRVAIPVADAPRLSSDPVELATGPN
jgi:dolichol-phosphate mannosyltransferase